MLVDWCEWTESERGVDEVAGWLPGDWVELDRGALGYRSQRRHMASGVRLLYDGAPGMGVHVEAKGQACRRLEALGVVPDWSALLGWLGTGGRKLSRLDVAIDEREGLIDPARMMALVEAGQCVSRWRTAKREEGAVKIGEGGAAVTQGVYFGSKTSDMRGLAYDKAAEQRAKGRDVDGSWGRFEVRARDDRACHLAAHLSRNGLTAIAAVLRGYLDFKALGSDTNRWRWATLDWWDAFLLGAAKTRMTRAPKAAATLDEVQCNAEQQYGAALAVIVEVKGVQEIVNMANRGRRRMRRHHHQLLAEAMAVAA